MLNVSRILVAARARRLVLAACAVGALAACGQKGDLYLPSGPAAEGRATLPQTLNPAGTPTTPQPAGTTPSTGGQGAGTAAPVRNP